MRLLILRSAKGDGQAEAKGAYTQEFRSQFARKVIGNLTGDASFCASCGPDCSSCRESYGRRLGPNIAGVIDLPSVLPHLIEDPGRYVPDSIPRHDILLVINIHEQILVEVLKRCSRWGVRGVVAPVEAPGWVSGSARKEAEAICEAPGVEIAFPKPFCSFDPPAGGVLAEFRREFHIGKPDVELRVRNGTIEEAYVRVSAACGATYYVARWLAGKRTDDDLMYDVIAKRMHSYPCTASMGWDEEIGDTIMHVASQAHYEILAPLSPTPTATPTPAQDDMVMSPSGEMIPRPPAGRENLKEIERGKEAILEALAGAKRVSLRVLGKRRRISAAAMVSAALLLKQQGKIRADGDTIVAA